MWRFAEPMRVTQLKLVCIAALVIGLLAACSQSRPAAADTTRPTLFALLDAQTRTVTGESVLIMGAVSDDTGIKTLSYSLNGGARQDVLSSLSGKTFSFTVAGLREGKNEITVSAADAAGNEGSVSLAVEVVPPAAAFPAVEGVWTAAGVATGMCGQGSSSLTFMFDAPQESGSLAGLWQMVDDDGSSQAAGSFAGTLTRGGAFAGVATLAYGERPVRFDLALTVSGTAVEGSLTSQEEVVCWNRKNTLSFEVTLKTFEDDAYETNDRSEDAAAVGLDFSQNLVLRGGNEDWFTFTLDKAQVVTLGLGSAGGSAGGYYDAPEVRLLGSALQSLGTVDIYRSDPELTAGLEAGTYYLRVSSGSLRHRAYSLSLSTAALPDAASEPNNTKAKATPVSPGFAGDAYLTVGDEDWFTFTLDKEQVVTLYLGGNTHDLRYAFDGAAGTHADFYPGRPVVRALKAGSHTLRVLAVNAASTPYSLSLSVTPLPDAALEPNNTFSTPTPVTLPFAGDLFVSEGDEDWFTFTLAKELLVTFSRTDSADYPYGLGGVLYTDAGTRLKSFGLSSRDTELAVLPAGTYRLSLSASQGFAYSLALSAETTDDASFEPNNTRAGASAVTLDFARDKLLVGDGDVDWFKFTLDQEAQVEIGLTATGNVEATLYNGQDALIYLHGTGSTSPTLSPGTYTIGVGSYWGLNKYGLSIVKK